MTNIPGAPENVRIATRDDEAEIFSLLMALNADNSFGITPRPSDIDAAIHAGTRNGKETGVFIGVIDGDHGDLAASACLVPNSWWYCKSQWYLNELWVFVRPEYRTRGAYFDDLFRFMIACQRLAEQSTGTKWPLVTSVSSLKRLPSKMRLWSRYGRLVGGIYLIDSEQISERAQAAE